MHCKQTNNIPTYIPTLLWVRPGETFSKSLLEDGLLRGHRHRGLRLDSAEPSYIYIYTPPRHLLHHAYVYHTPPPLTS